MNDDDKNFIRKEWLKELWREYCECHGTDNRSKWRRMDLLAEIAVRGDFAHDTATNHEIGRAIAALIHAGAGVDLNRKGDEWVRDDEIRRWFIGRPKGQTGADARRRIGAIYGMSPEAVRKVIRSTPADYWEEHFPEIDPDELDRLLRK